MKKLKLLVVFLFMCTISFSQEKKEETKEGWKKSGNISFLLNQAAFDNWIAGGNSNITGTLGVNYDFNYSKGDINWDNKLILAFGITKIKGDDIQKSDDRIEWNSLLGKKPQDIGFIQLS